MKSLHLLLLLVLVLLQAVASKYTLTVLHTNDVHARFEQADKYGSACSDEKAREGKCYGGVARRKTKLDELREKYNNTVFVIGGDEFQGTLWFRVFSWKAVAYFTNLLGIDAMGLGIHEFVLGVDELGDFLDNVTYPVLSANIDTSKEPALAGKFLKSTTKTVGGETVGMIGYTTVDTPKKAETGELVFTDVAAAIQEEVYKLQKAGVNKIIAVGHAGYDVDLETAKKVKGVDVIVGGYTNTFLYTGTPPDREKPAGDYPTVVTQDDGSKVLVVQDYAFGKYLGFLQVDFDVNGDVESWNGNPILLDKNTPEDPSVQIKINQWADILDENLIKVIGETRVYLNGQRKQCRLKECTLGNFLADALVWTYRAQPDGVELNKTYIAMVNSGSIQGSFKKGNITLKDVLTVWPYRDTIDIVEMKGKHLKAVLEHSVADMNPADPSGQFLQYSGLIVTYDLSRPLGSRLVSAMGRCDECAMPGYQPIQDEVVYSVIMGDYIAIGGDGYDMIPPNTLKRHLNGALDSDVLEEYIKKMSPISAISLGRISFATPPSSGVKVTPMSLAALMLPVIFSLSYAL